MVASHRLASSSIKRLIEASNRTNRYGHKSKTRYNTMSCVYVLLILSLLAVCGCTFCHDGWDCVLCSERQPRTRIFYGWWCGWRGLVILSAVSNPTAMMGVISLFWVAWYSSYLTYLCVYLSALFVFCRRRRSCSHALRPEAPIQPPIYTIHDGTYPPIHSTPPQKTQHHFFFFKNT